MRKGDLAIRETTVLFLAILVIIILSGVFIIISNSVHSAVTKTTCKISWGIKAFGDEKFTKFINPFDLYCPRTIVTVEDDKIDSYNANLLAKPSEKVGYKYFVREGDKIKSRSEVSKTAFQEDMSALIAYEMGECWDTFESGKVDLLNPDSNFFESNVCMVCSEIVIATDNAKGGFNDEYLKRHKTHFPEAIRPPLFYYDYLYSESYPHYSSLCKPSFHDNTLDFEEFNSFLVVYYRRGSWWDSMPLNLQNGIRIGASSLLPPPALALAVIFSQSNTDEECLGVGVVPVERVPEYCSVLVN